jgi:uncharacterized membrane protein YjjP (DUF1212 family)
MKPYREWLDSLQGNRPFLYYLFLFGVLFLVSSISKLMINHPGDWVDCFVYPSIFTLVDLIRYGTTKRKSNVSA